MNKISFYEDKHYYLSNFSSFEVKVRGFVFKTSEHAYQALRFNSKSPVFTKIFQARSAYEAKSIAHTHLHLQLEIYNTPDKRLPLMFEILIEKVLYDQTGYVKRNLMNTGDSYIYENSPYDFFWGIGADKSGENWLGKLWMIVRYRLNANMGNIGVRNIAVNKTAFINQYSRLWNME